MASKPSAKAMVQDVLFPDDGMPRAGKRRPKKFKTADFRRVEGKYKVDSFPPAGAKPKLSASAPSLRNNGILSDTAGSGALEVTRTLGHAMSETNVYKPKHFLQRGFGLGDRLDISKCFGANYDCTTGPGSYDVHEVGCIRWNKEEGNSFPGQLVCTNHKSCRVPLFPKAKTNSQMPPPLAQAPGPGHYAMADFWDPNWQRYPSLGKSFVRKLPPPGESRFGGLARQELRNAKGEMSFLQ